MSSCSHPWTCACGGSGGVAGESLQLAKEQERTTSGTARDSVIAECQCNRPARWRSAPTFPKRNDFTSPLRDRSPPLRVRAYTSCAPDTNRVIGGRNRVVARDSGEAAPVDHVDAGVGDPELEGVARAE